MGRGECGISFAETAQILLEGAHAFSSPSSVRRVTGTLLLDRRPRYGCQTGPLWRHKWPSRGQAHRASSSRRHLVRPQPLQTGRRGLSLAPRCGQHGDTWARGLGCAVQERPGVGATEGRAAFQVEMTLAGRTSGRKGRMCASGVAGAPALASAKGKGAPIWQGTGSSSRIQREHRSWPGSALLPGPRPHRLPGNGLQRQWPKT